MLIVSSIRLMLDLSVSVFRGHICYMLGSSSSTWVFRVCNCFAPVVFERRAYHTRSSRGASKQRTFAIVNTLGEHISWYFSKGSSYLCYRHSKKIRGINMINITYNQYKWYDMAIIILCLWSPSPKHRACDLHLQSTVTITIVTSLTPWSPSKHHCRLTNYCFYDYRYRA